LKRKLSSDEYVCAGISNNTTLLLCRHLVADKANQDKDEDDKVQEHLHAGLGRLLETRRKKS